MKIDGGPILASAGEAEALLKVLANRHRLMILCRLSGSEWPAGVPARALIEARYRIYCRPDRLCDSTKRRRRAPSEWEQEHDDRKYRRARP
jgi:hypothetical protein